jgi:hypothetical protein
MEKRRLGALGAAGTRALDNTGKADPRSCRAEMPTFRLSYSDKPQSHVNSQSKS